MLPGAILGADFEFGMDEVVTGTIDLLWLQNFGVKQKKHGRETTNLYIFDCCEVFGYPEAVEMLKVLGLLLRVPVRITRG